MSTRLFFYGSIGVLVTIFDVPPNVFIGSPILVDVVILSKVKNKGELC